VGVIISSPDIIWMTHNPPLWFLTCLFIIEAGFYLCYKLSSQFKAYKATCVFGLFFVIDFYYWTIRQTVPAFQATMELWNSLYRNWTFRYWILS